MKHRWSFRRNRVSKRNRGMDLFQKVYLDGTSVQSRTGSREIQARRLRGWNLILGWGQFCDLSGAVEGRGSEPCRQAGG